MVCLDLLLIWGLRNYMVDVISYCFIFFGIFFIISAVVGCYRLPDFFCKTEQLFLLVHFLKVISLLFPLFCKTEQAFSGLAGAHFAFTYVITFPEVPKPGGPEMGPEMVPFERPKSSKTL